MRSWGWALLQSDWYTCKKRRLDRHTFPSRCPVMRPWQSHCQSCIQFSSNHPVMMMWLNMGKRQPLTRPRRDTGNSIVPSRPQKDPILPTPWCWTSSCCKWETINFCCLCHLVCCPLLWQPQYTNTSCVLGKVSDLISLGLSFLSYSIRGQMTFEIAFISKG